MKIKLIENPSELGAGTRGSSLGINALKISALQSDNNVLNSLPNISLKNYIPLQNSEVYTPFALNIIEITERISELTEIISNTLISGEFPLIINGDHSSSAATIAGINKAYPQKRIGVIWVDAHADLHTPYTTPSGNVHGMPLAMSLSINNEECQRNSIQEVTLEKWEQLKGLNGINGKIKYSDIVFIGLRDTEYEEDYQIKKYGIKKIGVYEFRKLGASNVAHSTLDYLDKCDLIFISLDVDSLDPDEVSYGTGTPVKNGLLVNEEIELLKELFKSKDKIMAIDLCEINPLLDEKNKMAEKVIPIINFIIETVSKK